MKFVMKAFAVVALSLTASAALAQAQLDITGQVSWQTLNNQQQVNIKVERITNRSADYKSGTVIVKLRATSDPDIIGFGYTLAEIYLSDYADDGGRLDPGEYFFDIDITVPFSPPPDGTYYTHIAVYEFPNDTTVLDHVTTTGTTTWGNPNPAPNDDHADTFAGATTVSANNSYAGRLEQAGDTDIFKITISEPGTLQLWSDGTTDTYGRVFDGFENLVAQDDDSGDGLNFNMAVSVTAGTYYIAVNGFQDATIGDYVLTTSFTPDSGNPPPPPPPPPPPVSQPAADSGGGGSLGWFSLLALLSVRMFRRRS